MSTLNVERGETVANLAAATVAGDGTICVYTSTAMHVVVSPPKLERLLAQFGDLTSGRPGPWETDGRFRNRGGQPVPTVGR